eukprot:1160540-Pelagomonas_calceolata.AAC.13
MVTKALLLAGASQNELKQFKRPPILPHPPLTALPLSSLLIDLLLVQLQASFQVILSKLLAVAAPAVELPGAIQSQARGVLGVQLPQADQLRSLAHAVECMHNRRTATPASSGKSFWPPCARS